MKYLRAFLAAIVRDWIGMMSGGVGLLLTIFGFFLPTTLQPRMFLVLGVLCLFGASYRAWLLEYKRSEELLQRLALRLEFVHDPRVKPFYEVFPTVAPEVGVTEPERGYMQFRRLRVGLHNRGMTEIPQVRLLLEACNPDSNFIVDGKLFDPSPAIHLGYELQPMDKPQGTATVNLSADGTVYFDVAREMVRRLDLSGTLFLCYSQPLPNELPPRGDQSYKIILRAEGAGPAIRCSLELGGRLAWRLDGLTILPATPGS